MSPHPAERTQSHLTTPFQSTAPLSATTSGSLARAHVLSSNLARASNPAPHSSSPYFRMFPFGLVVLLLFIIIIIARSAFPFFSSLLPRAHTPLQHHFSYSPFHMPSDANPAISIRALTKTFGPKLAVSNLDLVVPTGSLCGFIGPNGAGKTTTIRMIMSIIFPDSGELTVLGKSSAIESKDRIGYLPEERGVYRKMKVLPFLTYMAKLKGVDSGAARQKALNWLAKVGLGDVAKKKCEELSKGMQQKVQFISAVIHEPDLLILDEVFSGLDPVNRRLMRDLIHEQHAAGRTIVFSTHAMYEAEQLCDRVFMIHRGVKVLDDTLAGIRNRFDPKTIVVEPLSDQTESGESALGLIRALPGISHAERDREGIVLNLTDGVPPSRIMAEIAALIPLRRIELKRVNLEDVFIDLVDGSDDDALSREDLRTTLKQEAAHV